MSLAHRSVYPSQPAPLRPQNIDLLGAASGEPIDGDLVALIVPDSNRTSGGPAAAQAYRLLQGADLDTAIVIAPSHHGDFGRLAICQIDAYHTPLGEVPVNDHLRNELCDEDDDIFLDDTGHYHTEGVDVQLPFLQVALDGDFDTVPIVMGEETPAICRELGHAVGEVMYGKQAIVVGSCDLLGGDADALDTLRQAIEAFNESELLYLLGSEAVTVEGMGALITTVIAAAHRGANRARVLALVPPAGGDPGVIACALWRT
ncbi:MAG: AmmeMemoRadiSam system protein B [Bacteroidota bacterium]